MAVGSRVGVVLAVGDGASVDVGLLVLVIVGWEVLVGGRSVLCNFSICVSVGAGFVLVGVFVGVGWSRVSVEDKLLALLSLPLQPVAKAIAAPVPRNRNLRLLTLLLSTFDDIVLEQLSPIIPQRLKYRPFIARKNCSKK